MAGAILTTVAVALLSISPRENSWWPKKFDRITTGWALLAAFFFALTDITVKGSWTGPARLSLVPHVNAPVADLPVRNVLGGRHFIADLTLPYGSVLHDYLA